jgi:PAS domain S-box-containing protein
MNPENLQRKRVFGAGRHTRATTKTQTGGPSSEVQRSTPWGQVFETLIRSRKLLSLLVSSEGRVESARTEDAEPLKPLMAMLRGRALADVFGPHVQDLLVEMSKRSAKAGKAEELGCLIQLSDGAHWLPVTIMRKENGNCPSIFTVLIHDVATRRRIREESRISETLLETAEKLGQLGTWEADLRTGQFVCSDQLLQVLEIGEGQKRVANDLLWRIIRRCCESGNHQRANDGLIRPHEYEFEYSPPRGGDGRVLWTRTVPRAGKSGPPFQFAGVVKDITKEKQREAQLQRNKALLGQCEELTSAGTWEYDVENKRFKWSPELCRIIGYDRKEEPVALEEVRQLLPVDERERACADLARVIRGERSIENEMPVMRADGHRRILHSRVMGVADASGQIVRIVGISQDVTQQKAEEERRLRSDVLLAQAEELAKLGSWEVDVRTGANSGSAQLFRLLRVDQEEWKQQAYWSNLHAADRTRIDQAFTEAVRYCKEFEQVGRYHVPGEGWRVFRARGMPVCGPDGKTARMIGVLQDITEQTRAEEELHQFSQRLMRARDEERRNTARELHETAGQSLAALKMTLGNLREGLPKRRSGPPALWQACADLVDEAAREVRTVSYLMHPPMLDEAGLASAIRWYAKGFSERSKIETEVQIPADFGRQAQETEMTLFRIVQEALTNIHRYSGSRVAKIRLSQEGGHVQVEVEDHGCGLSRPIGFNGRQDEVGVGIAGMRERVHQLNGTFEIESAPGRGTIIRANLPESVAAAATPGSEAKPKVTEIEERKPRSQKLIAKIRGGGES